MKDGKCVIKLKEQEYLYYKGFYAYYHHLHENGRTYFNLGSFAKELKYKNRQK